MLQLTDMLQDSHLADVLVLHRVHPIIIAQRPLLILLDLNSTFVKHPVKHPVRHPVKHSVKHSVKHPVRPSATLCETPCETLYNAL